MHLRTLAGPRRRTRRALLAAALPAALAACALPAAASTATVDVGANNTILYRAASGENNSLNVRALDGGALEIKDFAGLTSRTPLCAQVTSATVRCALGFQRLDADLSDRNDSTSIRGGSEVVVNGGSGDDNFFGGRAPTASRVRYAGGTGFDRMNYSADRGVRITDDGVANDGRPGDSDNVTSDIERLIGSAFADFISDSSSTRTEIAGGPGDDTLAAGNGTTVLDMGASADGADDIFGAVFGISTVDYSKRTRPVTVTPGFNGADDGEAGEGDEVFPDHDSVDGGQAGDILRARPGSTVSHVFVGNGGGDRIEGAEGDDSLHGEAGVDTILANGGQDFVDASDGGVSDIVGCGLGTDTASLDSVDAFSSCENRSVVGTLRLSPRTVKAKAGEPAHVRLSWRHPVSWRKLRKVELRLTQAGTSVGEVTIRPRTQRISADGSVQLVRKQTRLTRTGKTVTARLVLRLDESLAGQSLRAEVEATDTRGARQLERDVARLRVAG